MKPDGNGVLRVGIDLGTSRSSASANSGAREWVESFVGWPKDFLAARLLGKDVLCGAEALENRLSLDLYRPLQHGVIKEGMERNEEAVTELIRHLISLCKPEEGQEIYAVVGVPADTLKGNKLAIKRSLSGQVASLLVVSEPFAVAYGLDLLNNAMVIDIGAGTVDFCILHGTLPTDEDQKTILSAGDSIDDYLYSALKEKHPEAKFTMNMVRKFKEQHSFVGDPAGAVNVEMPREGRMVSHDITREIRSACESIMSPMIDTAAEMIARFDPEFQAKIKKNIVLAGGGSQIRGVGTYLKNALTELVGECQVTCVKDPLFGGSDGSLKLANDMPEKYWETM